MCYITWLAYYHSIALFVKIRWRDRLMKELRTLIILVPYKLHSFHEISRAQVMKRKLNFQVEGDFMSGVGEG